MTITKTTKTPAGSIYNATVRWTTSDGKPMSLGAARVDENGKILTVAGISCAPGQNTPAFDAFYRDHSMQARMGGTLEVVRDGAAAYRAKIAGLCL